MPQHPNSLKNLVPGGPGRPPGLTRRIRAETKDGRELVTFVLRVFRGKPVLSAGRRVRPSLRDRVEACNWLADRAFGRAVSASEMMVPPLAPQPLPAGDRDAEALVLPDVLSDEDRSAIRRALALTRPRQAALPAATRTNSAGSEEDR